MKYLINLFWLLAILSTFTLMSNRSGRGALAGEALTLAPGEGGRTCSNAGCHGSATPFDTEVSISLLDPSGTEVTTYEPGESYRVNLNITANGASGYGFMIVCLDGNDQAINNWGAPPSQIRNVNIFGRDYLEHTTRLADSSFEFDWTAPDAGTGDVIFYAAGNAVNGDNSKSGDNANTTTSTFSENIMSSVDDLREEHVKIFPNPVTHSLNLVAQGNYTIEIFNLLGRKEYAQSLSQSGRNILDISALTQGSYIMQVSDEKNQLIETKRIVKVD